MSTLGVYIQVPFCASKCSFCNFSSRVERSSLFDPYADCLTREIVGLPASFGSLGIPVELLSLRTDSVYMGGGTPTLLGEHILSEVVGALHDHLDWSGDVEFTLETTPGSADLHLLHALRRLGVNRLSIGVQTFDNQELRAVGRLHSADDSVVLVRQARAAGFESLSLDLIAGLPYQTGESFRRSLEATVMLRPEHVSLYLFEIDGHSRLGREVAHGGNRYHAEALPDEDFMADAYESGRAFLASEGYFQYEISNFSRPGFESRHNRKYWRLAPYVGLGAGAHSFDGVRRWANLIDVRAYMDRVQSAGSAIDECRPLTSEEQMQEFFFLGLRQVEGIDLARAWERWGAGNVRPWQDKLGHLAREGWIVQTGTSARLSPHAYLVSNEIFEEFVAA